MATLSDSAPPGWGIEARSSHRSSTSDGSPRAPRRERARLRRRNPARAAGCRRSARARPACRTGSSNPHNGTRKTEPIDARTAFGPVGSAQPSDSATPAPKASAARSSVPTLPGSPTCHSASVSGRMPRGRSSRRKTATTRGGCASVDTSASSSGRDVLARDERCRPARAPPPARPRRDPLPRPRTARACPASAGRGACGRA